MKYEYIGVVGNGSKESPYKVIKCGEDSPVKVDNIKLSDSSKEEHLSDT